MAEEYRMSNLIESSQGRLTRSQDGLITMFTEESSRRSGMVCLSEVKWNAPLQSTTLVHDG